MGDCLGISGAGGFFAYQMPATHQRHTSPHEYKPTCLEGRSRVPVSFQVDFSKDPCSHEAVPQELRQAVAGHHVRSNAATLRNSHSPPTPHHLQKGMGPYLHSAPWGMEGTPGLLLEVPPLSPQSEKVLLPLQRVPLGWRGMSFTLAYSGGSP